MVLEQVEAEAVVTARIRTEQRSLRRQAAINAVDLARQHRVQAEPLFTQSEADVIMAIMELLDRVADA
jgi:hypothetical protein